MSVGGDEFERHRAIRRRHLHERQAVVFGTLITAMVAAALLGLGVWFGAIPSPFNVPFATPAPPGSDQPCPPEGALPVPYAQISVNVLNGTARSGLAAATGAELGGRGLVIVSQGNAETRHSDPALVRSGPQGVAHAYTLAAMVTGALVELDERQDATVNLVLGAAFDGLLPPEEAALDPETPLTAPENCVPIPAPAPAV